ncbi:MAG: hypothetical protein CVU92_06930 [Firmicutes bacterium HGW-Firmicutes-17]|nr:MAG: hypothetical protein CVU92_06930 [Firmicutes bacterium HGW-Firmicutes-17]
MMRLFLIIFIQLLYVPMLTLRTICMVKNLKVLTGVFGFMEALIYIFGLAIVLSGGQSILEMVVYAAGFAAGLTLGIYIEQKLAIGFTTIQVNIEQENTTLIEDLRKEGFGVTVYFGEGKHGKRTNLDILTKRKCEKNLLKIIEKYEPRAFIVSFEPKMFRGGYLAEMMNGRLKRKMSKKDRQEKAIKSVIEKTVEEIKAETETLKKDWFED